MNDLRQPYFEILKTISEDNASRVVGRFSTISDVYNGIAYLLILPDKMVKGMISDLSGQNSEAAFLPTDQQSSVLFQTGEQCIYFDGYWGERAAIVLDSSRAWQKVHFKPSDAARYRIDGAIALVQVAKVSSDSGTSAEVVTGGWDHEHCVIDSTRIDPDENPEGYQDQYGTWVCTSCYEKYIVPKSLEFIVRA